ncbi:MAG: DUF4124 domain-containing protein [Acidobacteriota bacterium]
MPMQPTSFCLPVPGWIAAALIAALSWPTTAGVLRCQTADGRTLYQDSSCPNGARGEPVDATPNRGSRFATEQEIRKAMRPPPEERPRPARSSKIKVRQAVNAGERRFILPGLTAAEVRHRIGAPDQIAHRPSSSGKRRNRDGNQQWIYLPAADDPQTTTALTLKGGVVMHVERKVTR